MKSEARTRSLRRRVLCRLDSREQDTRNELSVINDQYKSLGQKLRDIEEQRNRTKNLLMSMKVVREMSDTEIRRNNLPQWYITNYPEVFSTAEDYYRGRTCPKFSAKMNSIAKLISKQKERVYDSVGDGMVYYEERLRPGRNKSEFTYDWFKPLCQWIQQYADRTMSKETYEMIMNKDSVEIFEQIKKKN